MQVTLLTFYNTCRHVVLMPKSECFTHHLNNSPISILCWLVDAIEDEDVYTKIAARATIGIANDSQKVWAVKNQSP